MQKSTKLFFAYTRVSTQRQGVEGVSLEAQRRAIQDYAQRQNLAITQWFEERQTAAERGRPIFVQMLSLLRKGKANGLSDIVISFTFALGSALAAAGSRLTSKR